jgi:hypothetical protein
VTDLTAHAEEALLGAIIRDASQLADIGELGATAFTDPVRSAIWAAVTPLREVAEGAGSREFADLILATTDDPAITNDYLTRLALSVPTPDAAFSYAGLVAMADMTRAVAGTASEVYPIDPLTGGPEIRNDVSYSACLQAALSALGQDMATPSGPPPSGEHAIREEQFLAGVISQPELLDWIRLNPDILTTPGLRNIYQATRTAHRLGDPVDEVTLPWRAARILAHSDYSAGRATTTETVAAAIPPGTIARLTAARTDPLTAMEAGRDLLASHACVQIAASAAARRNAASSDRIQSVGPEALTSQQAPLLRPPSTQELGHRPQLSQDGN